MYQRVVSDVIKQFGLRPVRIAPPQKGYRNESYAVTLDDGTTVNALFYKREPGILDRIHQADAVSEKAAQYGYPVRHRYDKRTLQIRTPKGISYVALYNYLPGTTIPWEAYSRGHIKLLGWAMSDLHAVTNDSQILDKSLVVSETRELLKRIEAYMSDPGVVEATAAKLGIRLHPGIFMRFHRLVAVFDDFAGSTYLHMDLVRGNALFAPAQPSDRWHIKSLALTGVIDFEKASFGPPIFDIARTLAFLPVDCPFYSSDKIESYFLKSGYNKRGASHFDSSATTMGYKNRQLLHGLVGLFLLHDFYKFLRHTPYESLHENHHYQRTRDILVDYGMIRYHKKL